MSFTARELYVILQFRVFLVICIQYLSDFYFVVFERHNVITDTKELCWLAAIPYIAGWVSWRGLHYHIISTLTLFHAVNPVSGFSLFERPVNSQSVLLYYSPYFARGTPYLG